ncbi:MAG: HIT family protein, partial [Nanoarchaeota archaeon]|nr:HIT family protein [Nanoarchaeota archaeon]
MPEQQPQQQMSEEQVKALQEKLKNMSPEELKEFQKKQCIFCQIISGKVQSRKVYDDDLVVAILDVNPANPGHILIMPKEHYSIMPQMPDEEVSHIFVVAKALSNASLRALEAQGSNIIVANGVAAGQKAQHFMVHLIPRMENDNIGFQIPQKPIPEEELQNISKILSESMGQKAAESAEKIAPILFIPAQKKVVEAEFRESKKPVKDKKDKNEIKENKAQQEKSPKKEKKESGSINLD